MLAFILFNRVQGQMHSLSDCFPERHGQHHLAVECAGSARAVPVELTPFINAQVVQAGNNYGPVNISIWCNFLNFCIFVLL
ncbi:MAG: hypothetical protein BWY70_00593 [Bacteroidetes bacterium ADurb.Bin408]|nr:MAG: hypothetical protein BWY70_00593 [Bacteroidetes bacterium ADurb.Bin408]